MAKKDFKVHMMYCKDGTEHEAKTYEEHLKLKKKGCGHKKPKGKAMKMDAYRDVDPSPVDPKTGKKVARKRDGGKKN